MLLRHIGAVGYIAARCACSNVPLAMLSLKLETLRGEGQWTTKTNWHLNSAHESKLFQLIDKANKLTATRQQYS
jgi:hypothetical protein